MRQRNQYLFFFTTHLKRIWRYAISHNDLIDEGQNSSSILSVRSSTGSIPMILGFIIIPGSFRIAEKQLTVKSAVAR